MKCFQFSILLFFLFFKINAQTSKNELGKVTIEELNEKVYPLDTSAAAAIIFKSCKIQQDTSLGKVIIETDVKLKIYKKEAYQLANVSEGYYSGYGENVYFTDVATYNLVNGTVVKTNLKKESEFKEEATKNVIIKKIALSDVKEGSIIEYKIKRYSNNYFRLVDFYFQEDIPIKRIELKVENSDKYYYNKTVTGYLEPETSNSTFNDVRSSYIQNRCVYKLENVPAMKDEGFVNNINNYRTRVRYELASIRNSMGFTDNLSTDWETVTKRVYESELFGDELKKTGYFEKDIDALLTGLNTKEEKMNAVFNYVKSRIKWDEYYGYSCNDGVKKAYQQKKGNVAEINLMLTAMLRYAGFDANPILISTRSNGVSIFPSLTAFNYVIVGIELQDNVIMLDATNKNAFPNILPIRDLNWVGRIIRKNESSAQTNLIPKTNSKDIVNILANINAQGEVSGKIREQYFDYNAFLFREKNSDISKDVYIEKLEKKYTGLEIGEYEVMNNNDLTKPVIENYSFSSSTAVEIIGDKMYISPFLFFATTENPFKQETREYPVDFIYPKQDRFNISINLPEGYTVETIPVAASIAMIDNKGSFKYSISNNGKQIQLLYTFDLNEAIIGAEYYEVLKNFFKEIVSKQTEKIVLKKV